MRLLTKAGGSGVHAVSDEKGVQVTSALQQGCTAAVRIVHSFLALGHQPASISCVGGWGGVEWGMVGCALGLWCSFDSLCDRTFSSVSTVSLPIPEPLVDAWPGVSFVSFV